LNLCRRICYELAYPDWSGTNWAADLCFATYIKNESQLRLAGSAEQLWQILFGAQKFIIPMS
jgi:hypothetical protein